MTNDPLSMPKTDYTATIQRISLADSPVGIDAQYTHAIIIEYLRQITARLERMETQLESAR